jgi:bacillithiol biosynthesis cysteine-adding enzyme BshC
MPETVTIDRRKTFFNNPFLEEYFFTAKLDRFKSYASPDEIKTAIATKESFGKDRRQVLVQSLKRQYEQAGISKSESELVFDNIELLNRSNSYTVTTGQQIHIGLGPMYVLYKASDAIAIASELKAKYPESNFIPIFWMATEDHDLEEIAQINVFGKTIEWETDQKGPVGRMKPDGIPELFQQILADFNFNEDQTAFLSKCKEVYSESENISIAFTKLLHSYLAHTGLVILDADSSHLKELMKPIFKDEIRHNNHEALESTSAELESEGYDRQLHIRDNNLFTLANGDRLKVDSSLISDIDAYVEENYEDLSPNAALRPLYQEWILPNLVYVGGGSEIKYWSQLIGLFKNYELPMPYLHLRSSKILLPHKLKNSLGTREVEELFGSLDDLRLRYAEGLSEEKKVLDASYLEVLSTLENYASLVSETFNGFNFRGKIDKITPKLKELKILADQQVLEKGERNSELNKVLKTRVRYFSSDSVQERIDHVLAHPTILEWSALEVHSHFGLKYSQKIDVIFT